MFRQLFLSLCFTGGKDLKKVIFKRLINAIPLLFAISIVAFLLIKLAPGDPIQNFVTPDMNPEDVERIRKSLGLDQPIHVQYILWLQNILTGNFGYSLINHRPVLDLIMERLPATLGLMGTSLVLSLLIAIPLGLFTAAKEELSI